MRTSEATAAGSRAVTLVWQCGTAWQSAAIRGNAVTSPRPQYSAVHSTQYSTQYTVLPPHGLYTVYSSRGGTRVAPPTS